MKIKRITKKKFNGTVYNLTVHASNYSGDHSYICNTISVNNCVMLDGVVFAPGATIADHPSGMCVFIPIFKPLQELGFDPKDVPAKHRAAFDRLSGSTQTMRSKFFAKSAEEQRAVFNNESLFRLWRDEDLPLQSLVQLRNDMFVPKSFKQVKDTLPKLGGINHPKAGVSALSDRSKKRLIAKVDPVDRATNGIFLVRYKDVPPSVRDSGKLRGRHGGNGLRDGSDVKNVNAIDTADSFVAWTNNPPWWDLNEKYRALGVYLRQARDGSLYYALPRAKHKRLLSLIK